MRSPKAAALVVLMVVVVLCVALAVPYTVDRPHADLAVVERLLDCALLADASDPCEHDELPLRTAAGRSTP